MHIENVKLEVDKSSFEPQYKIELILPIAQVRDIVSDKTEEQYALDFYRTFNEKINEIIHYN